MLLKDHVFMLCANQDLDDMDAALFGPKSPVGPRGAQKSKGNNYVCVPWIYVYMQQDGCLISLCVMSYFQSNTVSTKLSAPEPQAVLHRFRESANTGMTSASPGITLVLD